MDRLGFDPRHAAADHAPSSRARSRDSMFLLARLRIDGEAGECEVRVRNLSERGLMLDLSRSVPLGTAVSLELRGVGEVSGRVAWCAEARIGISLDRAIDPRRARRSIPGGTGGAPRPR